MIKLENILNEVTNAAGVNAGAIAGADSPKAIILAGAPGAGKGFILKGLNISNLQVLNIDDTYIDNLKQANVSLDLKNATPEERSKQAYHAIQRRLLVGTEDGEEVEVPKVSYTKSSLIVK